MSENSNFKEGLKGTSLFGGVQVFKILISIVRSKLVAVLLGPSGMGILGLLNSTIDLIYNISNVGLTTSAIRDLSEANAQNDSERLKRVIAVFRKLVWITGIIGTLICLMLSPVWSKLTFGNHDYTVTFILIAITILFRQLSDGQNALLQGTHRYKFLAISNLWGGLLGLLFTIPMYYFWGVAGIAPGIVATYFINLCLSWYYSNKIKIERLSISIKNAIIEGKGIIRLGFFLALNGLFGTAVAYLIRAYVGYKGGVADVGLYTAGFAIVETYVGMIFTAMGTEYYPRISGLAKNEKTFNDAINQQIEISLYLMAPLICLFVVFGRLGIVILYSNEFLPIEMMLYLAMIGILFKAPSWCFSYAILAKGDSKVFFFSEIVTVANVAWLNMLFYNLFGITGLGISFIIVYILYLIQESLICKIKYNYRLHKNIVKTFVFYLSMIVSSVIISTCLTGAAKYVLESVIALVVMYVSFNQIRQKINIIGIFKSRFKR